MVTNIFTKKQAYSSTRKKEGGKWKKERGIEIRERGNAIDLNS